MSKRNMPSKRKLKSWSFSLAISAMGLVAVSSQIRAADLDSYQPRRPSVIAGDAGPALDPRCRIIPQPEANLYGDTTRFRPTVVCMSRGIYADLYKPYPVYHPYYGEWLGDYNTPH